VAAGTIRPITTVGIFRSPHVQAAGPLARDIAATLRRDGVEVWESERLDGPDMVQRMAHTDLLVTLGGDGSILRAARVTVGHETLILGVNLGRMGFLTEAEPDGWREVLPLVVRGDYWVEERMMLEAQAWRETEVLAQGNALNDVVVGRGALGRVVRLAVCVDGDPLATYVADGLIVATATGSTAYALAAGGPIMPPQQRNILLVPVAPHLSLDRAVVLAEGVRVRVVVHGYSPAALILDGETMAELVAGDVVQVGASPHVARFARVRERDYFYRTLTARLVPKDATNGERDEQAREYNR